MNTRTVKCKDCGCDVVRPARSRRERCDGCRRAIVNLRQRAQRKRYQEQPYNPADTWHGTTTGYSTRGCKCEPCRTAGLEYLRKWNSRPEVKERRKAANRDADLQARYALNRRSYMYGIDKGWMEYLTAERVCWACGDESDELLHVDHDHRCCPTQKACGKCFRGMLCRRCNLTLGVARDSTDRLGALISYLERCAA